MSFTQPVKKKFALPSICPYVRNEELMDMHRTPPNLPSGKVCKKTHVSLARSLAHMSHHVILQKGVGRGRGQSAKERALLLLSKPVDSNVG